MDKVGYEAGISRGETIGVQLIRTTDRNFQYFGLLINEFNFISLFW